MAIWLHRPNFFIDQVDILENTQSLKIIIITHSPTRGGTERSAINLALGLAGLGSKVRVYFTASKEGSLNKSLEVSKIWYAQLTNYLISDQVHEIAIWNPTIINFQILKEDFPYIKQLREACPDARFIETNVFSDVKQYSKYFDLSLQLSLWCKLNYLSKYSNIKKPPAAILPNPIDTKEMFKASPKDIDLFKKKYRIPQAAWYAGRVGQPSEEKWDVGLIEDLLPNLQKHSRGIILFIGAPPSHEIEVKKLSRELQERFIFLPLLDDRSELRAFYSCLNVFLHYSKIGESFGLVLAEALLCECPVITRFVLNGDNTQIEIIKHARRGWVLESGHDFDAVFTRVLSQPELAARMALNGRAHVIKNFSIAAVAARFIEIASKTQVYSSRFSLIESLKLTLLTIFSSRRSLLIWSAYRTLKRSYSLGINPSSSSWFLGFVRTMAQKAYKTIYGI